jgi:hypothetical protein
MRHHHEVKDVRRDADHVVQDEHNVTQVEHNVMQVKSTKTFQCAKRENSPNPESTVEIHSSRRLNVT